MNLKVSRRRLTAIRKASGMLLLAGKTSRDMPVHYSGLRYSAQRRKSVAISLATTCEKACTSHSKNRGRITAIVLTMDRQTRKPRGRAVKGCFGSQIRSSTS